MLSLWIRGTQWFVFAEYLFERPKSLEIFGFYGDGKLESSMVKRHLKLSKQGDWLIHLFSKEQICGLECKIYSHLAFSESQRQLGNIGGKIPFPKIFFGFNFQLNNSNRPTSISLHKYPSENAKTICERGENDISVILLKSSGWLARWIKSWSVTIQTKPPEQFSLRCCLLRCTRWFHVSSLWT